jgi:hypothetical protein
MGHTECDVHGGSGILPLCDHLLLNIQTNSIPDLISSVWTSFSEPSGAQGFVGVFICIDCVRSKELSQSPQVLTVAEFEHVDMTDTSGICLNCFEDFIERMGIKWEDITPEEFHS